MESIKNKCELCNMEGVYIKKDSGGVNHYFCEHHAPEGAIAVEGVVAENKFKKFLPLVIIFSSIILFTTIATYLYGFSWVFAMRMMMGSFFLVFGGFKIFNLNAFADAYNTYDILAKRFRSYALVYPFFELGLAVLYLFDFGGIYRDIFTFF